MQNRIVFLLSGILFLLSLQIKAQDTTIWTEADRTYLLQNLTRSKETLIKETQGLTDKQWNFKESPDRWSIKEITEHIGIWEFLILHEISRALGGGRQPELNKKAKPDSIYYGFIMEDRAHIAEEYTKPFTYTVPMGLAEGKDYLAWVLKMRNESIEYIKTAKEDLRFYFQYPGRPSVHQRYITMFGHADRHLKQIVKVKAHPNYPK
jgi:DinB superfamily